MKSKTIDAAPIVGDPMADQLGRVERYIEAQLAVAHGAPQSLTDAMQHAALAGGKRVRPILCVLVNSAAGARNAEFALAAGAAVEFIHCASLILDDLPCMDDAKLRRGRAAAHLEHGESTAILASIALMNLAYEQLAKAPIDDEYRRARAMQVLTKAVGTSGLVAGQERDLREKAAAETPEELERINWLKTGVLFVAAAELGAIAAGATEAEIADVAEFASHLGMAFQTRDDILDQVASSKETGKDSHKDDDSATLIRLAGFSAASGDCRNHLEQASAALKRSGLREAEIAQLIQRVFKQLSDQTG